MLTVLAVVLAFNCTAHQGLLNHLWYLVIISILMVLYEIVGTFVQAWVYDSTFVENLVELMTVRRKMGMRCL